MIAVLMSACTSGSVSVRSYTYAPKSDTKDRTDCLALSNAMRHMNIECEFNDFDDESKDLWNAFRKSVLSDNVGNDSVLLGFQVMSLDSTISELAGSVLLQSLEDRGSWRLLDSISRILHEKPTSLTQTAAFEPKLTISVTEFPDTLHVEFNSWNVPIVEVSVNGSVRKFWLDTGASEMVISSDVAEEIGIVQKSTRFDTIPTATTFVLGYPVMIDQLSIGKSRFTSVPFVLIEERYLHKKYLSLITEYKIDGIIGWRILKELDIIIDYNRENIIINTPRNDVQPKNNLLFFERPYVRLTDLKGRPLLMFLDTGSEFSSFSPDFAIKYPELSSHWAFMSYQGVGGSSVRIGKKINSISIPYDAWMIHFRDVPVVPISKKKFISHDGILGSDLFHSGKIRLDWTNRTFEYTPSQRCIE